MTEPQKTRMRKLQSRKSFITRCFSQMPIICLIPSDLMRTTVAFYIVGLIFLFFCLMAGICGCWRRSPSLILTTGILLLFASKCSQNHTEDLTLSRATILCFLYHWSALFSFVLSCSHGRMARCRLSSAWSHWSTKLLQNLGSSKLKMSRF